MIVSSCGEELADNLLLGWYRVVGAGALADSTAIAQVVKKQWEFSFNPKNRVFSVHL